MSFSVGSPSAESPSAGLTLVALILCSILWATGSAAAQETPPSRSSLQAAGCIELLENGGFETTGIGWAPIVSSLPSQYDLAYVVEPIFAGDQAIRTGYLDAPNTEITNGAAQTVELPASASTIVLSYRYLPVHEENPEADLQFVDVLDPGTGERITRIWDQLSDRSDWLFIQFDLTYLRGQRIQLVFGASNDGRGGRSALFVDEVSLLACDVTSDASPKPTPTPTSTLAGDLAPSPSVTASPSSTPSLILISPTPTGVEGSTLSTITPSPTSTSRPSPTPLPQGCVTTEVLFNGSFEESLADSQGWILGNDPVPPELSNEPYHGLRSMRLGYSPDTVSRDVVTFSSVRQLVTIPATARTAQLSWIHRSHTQEQPNSYPKGYEDRQDVILLTSTLATRRILYRQLLNLGEWRTQSADLTPFIGETFYIYFNVFNDGNSLRTWMLLDNVHLEICYSAPALGVSDIPSPHPSTFPSPTITPTGIARATLDVGETAAPEITPETAGDVVTDSITMDAITTTNSLTAAENSGRAELVSTAAPDTDADDAPLASSESSSSLRSEQSSVDGSFVRSFGGFLGRNWRWAIPWALLGFLLLWRFFK